MASRWALKEALVKATGRTDLDYKGVYLKKNREIPRSKPILTVDGERNLKLFYEDLNVTSIHASISHEELFAIAFVTLEGFDKTV